MGPLNPGTARHLVYGGIELARELGFRLPRKYERWTAILGPLPDGESPDMSLFRAEGKIRLVCDVSDLEARLIGTTPEKFLNRPDVEYILGDEGFTTVDEEADEIDDALDELEESLVERVRQWCFANGQPPHPLLPEVVSTMMEAVAELVPPDLDPEDDVLALSDQQEERVFERMTSFLSASFEHDPEGLAEAMAQLQGYMDSTSSPEEFFESLGVAGWPIDH